jgi:hypothetical protein
LDAWQERGGNRRFGFAAPGLLAAVFTPAKPWISSLILF